MKLKIDTVHKHFKCIKCSSEHKETMAVYGTPINIMHQLICGEHYCPV